MSTDVFIEQVTAAWRNHAVAPVYFVDRKNRDGSIDRIQGPDVGRKLTDTHVRIAAILRRFADPDRKQPEIAREARVHTRTVQRAFNVLRALGLLSWDRQFVVSPTWRARIVNAYHFLSAKVQETQSHFCPGTVSPPVGYQRYLAKKAARLSEKAKQMDIFEAKFGAPKLENTVPFAIPSSVALTPPPPRPASHDSIGDLLRARREKFYETAKIGPSRWRSAIPA